MRIVETVVFFDRLTATSRATFDAHLNEVRASAAEVHWPAASKRFVINPTLMGNGVVPIKQAFALDLAARGWNLETAVWPRGGPGRVDATKGSSPNLTMVEWETGNISSSHRALAKMSLALLQGVARQGILVLPTTALYRFLTDRIGNWGELQVYRPIYSRLDLEGRLIAVVIEHDAVDPSVPLIRKGTDGRALR